MSLLDKIRNMVTDEYEEDDYDENEAAELEEDDEEESTFMRRSNAKVGRAAESDRRPVTPMNLNAGLQVVLVKPERFEDCTSIGDHLCQKKTVVLNLESATKDVSKRLIDFLSGVAYANKGNIKRVANSTFIITPANVDVTGDLVLEELESGTMYL